ncbi:MAG: membrane protein insertase YidC, partial [Gallionella sp.]|nr:membrane protein insertase YidC [Gallionella sp.]
MDLQRLFLFLIFVFSLGLVWDGWQRHQHPEQYVQQSAAINGNVTAPQVNPPAAATPAAIAQHSAQQSAGKIIHVKTDILEAEISTIGGDISRLALLKHPDGLDKNKPLVLFHRGTGTHNYVAQSGLLGAGLPNHNSLFVSEQDQYALAGNAEQVQVRLTAEAGSALKVTKLITFHKGSYLVDIAYELENTGQQAATTSSYFQLIRDSVALAGSSMFLPTYVGAAVYTDKEKFQKVEFPEIEKARRITPSWPMT